MIKLLTLTTYAITVVYLWVRFYHVAIVPLMHVAQHTINVLP